MHKTYVNALVMDKDFLEIDPVVKDNLKTFYQRNLIINHIAKNPIQTIIKKTEDECLEEASQLNFNYVILTWEGNIINTDLYHRECVNYINQLGDDWLVAGHLMDQQKNRLFRNDPDANEWVNSFWLFPITAIVNIKKWEQLGKPKWGGTDGSQLVCNALPSSECVHDNYTPLSIVSDQSLVKANTKKGWNIINSALASGLTVFNLSTGIRNNQNYLYPENNIDKYNKFWLSLYTMPKLNDQYRNVLEKILPGKFAKRINDTTWKYFIRNTESYFPEENNVQANIDWTSIDTIALPSSGFKDFILSMSKHSARKRISIVHFDIIKQCNDIKQKMIERWDGSRSTFAETLLDIGSEYNHNLIDRLHKNSVQNIMRSYENLFQSTEIKQKMIERWDGKSSTFAETLLDIGSEYNCKPTDTFHMNSMKDVIEAYDHLLPYFHSEDDLQECWQKFKTFDHKYIEADLLDDPMPVIREIDSKRLYICLSDIACWKNNIISYGYKNLRSNIATCIEKLQQKNINGYIDYKDPGTDLQMWQEFDHALIYLRKEI